MFMQFGSRSAFGLRAQGPGRLVARVRDAAQGKMPTVRQENLDGGRRQVLRRGLTAVIISPCCAVP